MRIEYLPRSYAEVDCDLLAFPVFEDEPKGSGDLGKLRRQTSGVSGDVLSTGEFKPELNRTCLIHAPSGLKARRLLLVGAGKKASFDLASLRKLAGTAVRSARAASCSRVALLRRSTLPARDAARAAAEGALYGDYESDAHKTREKERREIREFLLVGDKSPQRKAVEEGIRRGIIIGDATNFARELSDEPGNLLTPTRFAEHARAKAAEAGLEVEVLEQDDLERMGMNTLLAVSRGSDEPPKLIILRIPGRQKKGPLYALLGKGVTFDSGGISIKPADRMEDMKADMAGGAAVLGAMLALARLRPRHRVMGLIPAVENLPSGKATRPGDVVKSYLGKTVEIINTDAEGRLILADALAYARKLGATHLIDVATLTGACAIALGTVNAGMMGNDAKLIDRLRRNCSVTGEKLWQLPLDEEYRKLIRSEIADMKNTGPRYGGAISAAKFLQEFVEDTPWVHLDIAGVDLDHEGTPYSAKGSTGFGVRTLVQLLMPG